MRGACLSIPRGRDRDGFAFSRGGADEVGSIPMRRRQRRMKANPSGPCGLALQGASAALRGLGVESTTPSAARPASAPLQSQRGSRGILRQAPLDPAVPRRVARSILNADAFGNGLKIMQIAMVGLGRMGANMAARLMRG